MKFKNFKLCAPTIQMVDVQCKECGRDLRTTDEETVWYCPKCERLYTLVLRKIPKSQEKSYDPLYM